MAGSGAACGRANRSWSHASRQADEQADEALLARFELVKETITAVRNIRKQKNLPQREALTLEVIADANYPVDYAPVLTKMANLSAIERVAEKDAAAAAFIVKTTQYFVPLGDRIDREAEIAKLGEELTYYEGFLQSVERKLSNERFVQSAPAAVVEKSVPRRPTPRRRSPRSANSWRR